MGRRMPKCPEKKAAWVAKKAAWMEAKAAKSKPKAKANAKAMANDVEEGIAMMESGTNLEYERDSEDRCTDLQHELDSEDRWRPYYPQDRDVPEESSDEAEEETEEDADTGGFP